MFLSFTYFIALAPLYTSAASVAKRSINGPVITGNFPDPSILTVNGVYYAFSTTNAGHNVPVRTSADFVTWTPLPDALPAVGAWSSGKDVWAPDVVQLDDGSFLMYYTARVASKSGSGTHCVSAATSASPAGPYTPLADVLACPISDGGAIDPAAFIDADGALYMLWKVDGSSIGRGGPCGNAIAPIVPTPIMIQRVAANGTAFYPGSTKTQLLDRDANDEPLIEAPSLVRSADGTYVLFFSSNCFNSPLYDVAYATAPSVLGPYTKGPWLLKTGRPFANLYAPGGFDVDRAGTQAVFHADLGNTSHVRQMYTADISISGGTVSIA